MNDKCKCEYWASVERLPDNKGNFNYYCRGCDSWFPCDESGTDEEYIDIWDAANNGWIGRMLRKD